MTAAAPAYTHGRQRNHGNTCRAPASARTGGATNISCVRLGLQHDVLPAFRDLCQSSGVCRVAPMQGPAGALLQRPDCSSPIATL